MQHESRIPVSGIKVFLICFVMAFIHLLWMRGRPLWLQLSPAVLRPAEVSTGIGHTLQSTRLSNIGVLFDIEKRFRFPGHHPSCHSCGIPGSRGPSARYPASSCGRPPGLILQQDREHHVLCWRGSLLHLWWCVRSLLWSHSEHVKAHPHTSLLLPSNKEAHAAQSVWPVCCFSSLPSPYRESLQDLEALQYHNVLHSGS